MPDRMHRYKGMLSIRAPARMARGGDSVRGLWFTAGFLLGVVTTALGLLWLMTMAVVA